MRPPVTMPTIKTRWLYTVQFNDRNYDELDAMIMWLEKRFKSNEYHIGIVYANAYSTLPEGWIFSFNRLEDLTEFKLACL